MTTPVMTTPVMITRNRRCTQHQETDSRSRSTVGRDDAGLRKTETSHAASAPEPRYSCRYRPARNPASDPGGTASDGDVHELVARSRRIEQACANLCNCRYGRTDRDRTKCARRTFNKCDVRTRLKVLQSDAALRSGTSTGSLFSSSYWHSSPSRRFGLAAGRNAPQPRCWLPMRLQRTGIWQPAVSPLVYAQIHIVFFTIDAASAAAIRNNRVERQSDIHPMDGRFSNHCITCPSCDDDVGSNFTDSLRNYGDRPVLFSDCHIGVRDRAASPPLDKPRPLQGMAGLLAPFAGEGAPELIRLLRRELGALGRAFAAPSSHLARVGRKVAPACELPTGARRPAEATDRNTLQSRPIDTGDHALLAYLRSRLCRGKQERLLVVFCTANREYICDEEMGWGTAHTVHLDASQLFRRALTLNAGALLLAHNHPSGDCTPSAQDIAATRRLADLGNMLGLYFLDHLIVTHGNTHSMRAGTRL